MAPAGGVQTWTYERWDYGWEKCKDDKNRWTYGSHRLENYKNDHLKD